MQPLVSIIVPCYNQQQFVAECLKSILAQTYTHWQCIVINDGSTDDTEAVVKNTIHDDDRVTYVYQRNAGVSAARNVGLARATGEYIAFLDGDDWWHPEFLEKMTNYGSSIVICNCNLYYQNSKKIIERKPTVSQQSFTRVSFLENWEIVFSPAIHSVIVKSQLLKNFNFNTDLRNWEDLDFWLHIVASGSIDVSKDERYLCYYRQHKASSSKGMQSTLESLKKTHNYFLKTLQGDERELYVQLIIKYYTLVAKTLDIDISNFKKSWGYKINRISIFIYGIVRR